jgi:hypothetical protein
VYEFCPFGNVTQTEAKGKRDRFLLGIWSHWHNDGWSQMVYSDGDECSDIGRRRTVVQLQCGAADEFSVGEVRAHAAAGSDFFFLSSKISPQEHSLDICPFPPIPLPLLCSHPRLLSLPPLPMNSCTLCGCFCS